METLVALQRWIYGSLSADLSAFAVSRDWALLTVALPIGIVFGAINALTPGHGKIILASYIVGSRLKAFRAMAVAGTLAFTHVFMAVLIALAAASLVARTLGGAGRAPLLENLSMGLIMLLGLWFLIRAFRDHKHTPGEGLLVGMAAGLVPCPLTLFAMFAALSRGVPEAGLTFAVAMMLGVSLTLG